mmetsp:Transcript_11498/g.70728  ORF Transcript_11498/g.70728 Transcript_11498/m.70728 type:complete len:102 (-) Transcript_11498:1356-1661(-)
MDSKHVRWEVEENLQRGAAVPVSQKSDRKLLDETRRAKPCDMDGAEARRKAAARAKAGVRAADKLGAFLLVAAGAAAWLYSKRGEDKSAPSPQKNEEDRRE